MIRGLLDAIVAGDVAAVRAMLAKEPQLVAQRVEADRFIDGIHWLYVGDTALHLAAAALQDEIVALLLERGADANAVNRRGASPLHYVSDPRPHGQGLWNPEAQVQIINRLADAGAHVSLPDDGGATPLHRAVRARSVAAVHALLARGADASARLRPSGSTPLHLAVTGSGAGGTAKTLDEQLEIVHALLARGADPHRADRRGRSAASAARSPEIRTALLRQSPPAR